MTPGYRLEQYSLRHPQVVLLVHALVDGDMDQVLIFKGFSSSLVRPTAFDPDVPVLPAAAAIQAVDILAGPYTPESPRYLHQGLSWSQMLTFLDNAGV
ncbi:MAG: hypothetical protein EA342_16650 [Leptolyngbya sp. LCM1.Bin17]|nr:MAG: hypothetical protein EA342_16650 [Leptolyngbya sp. LCM1.Bin17]